MHSPRKAPEHFERAVKSNYELTIIEGGPAGLTAGLYASRAGLEEFFGKGVSCCAAGDGATAAISAEKLIRGIK